MNTDFRGQIYNELNLRETEDLLEIWYTNDHEEWSDAAFAVIQKILIERLGEIPPQEEIVDEDTENAEEDIEQAKIDDDGLKGWEAKLLDNDNQPDYYDVLDVLELRDNINKTAKAVIVIYTLTIFTTFPWLSSIVVSFFQYRLEFLLPIYLITFVVLCLGTAVTIAAVYFPLKALVSILRILMEMEFNSRKTN